MNAVTATNLNPYLNELPADIAQYHKTWAFRFNVLEKICWVAFIGIAAVILTASYTGLAMTGNLPIFLVGGIFTALFAVPLATKLHHLRIAHSDRAKREMGIDKKYQDIIGKGEDFVRQFFIEQKIDIQQIPLDALKKKNPVKPLCALLPLIARFIYLKEQAETLEKESKEGLKLLNEEMLDPISQHNLLLNRQIAYQKHEMQAIPRALEAAVILQVIQQPILQLELSRLGTFNAKSFEERQFDRLYGPRNERYFTLNGGKILKLNELEKDLSPSTLRPMLFA